MNFLVLLSVLILPLTSFAADAAKCEGQVADAALKKINRTRGFSGNSSETRSITGTKTLHVGGFLENYVVLVSDEVEPSEWYVVMERKTCKIKYLGVTNDGSPSEIWDN